MRSMWCSMAWSPWTRVEFIRSIGGTLAEGTLLSNAMSANEFLMRLETMGTSLPEAALEAS